MLKDTAVHSSRIYILSWELGVGYIDEIQYCAEELNGWTGGTENCVEGRPLMSHMSIGDWGVGWTGGTENCVEGHHGTSLELIGD